MKFFNNKRSFLLISFFLLLSLFIGCSTKKRIRIDANVFGKVEKFWLKADLKSFREFKKFKILCFRDENQWQFNFYSLTNIFLIELFLSDENHASAINYRKKIFWSGFADNFYQRFLQTSLFIEDIYQLLVDQETQNLPRLSEEWKQSRKDGWLILENRAEKIHLRLKKEESIFFSGQLRPPELKELKRVELNEFIEAL